MYSAASVDSVSHIHNRKKSFSGGPGFQVNESKTLIDTKGLCEEPSDFKGKRIPINFLLIKAVITEFGACCDTKAGHQNYPGPLFTHL